MTFLLAFISGKDMELPFGENLFAKKPIPSSSVNVNKAPSPPPFTQKALPLQQRQRKKEQSSDNN